MSETERRSSEQELEWNVAYLVPCTISNLFFLWTLPLTDAIVLRFFVVNCWMLCFSRFFCNSTGPVSCCSMRNMAISKWMEYVSFLEWRAANEIDGGMRMNGGWVDGLLGECWAFKLVSVMTKQQQPSTCPIDTDAVAVVAAAVRSILIDSDALVDTQTCHRSWCTLNTELFTLIAQIGHVFNSMPIQAKSFAIDLLKPIFKKTRASFMSFMVCSLPFAEWFCGSRGSNAKKAAECRNKSNSYFTLSCITRLEWATRWVGSVRNAVLNASVRDSSDRILCVSFSCLVSFFLKWDLNRKENVQRLIRCSFGSW